MRSPCPNHPHMTTMSHRLRTERPRNQSKSRAIALGSNKSALAYRRPTVASLLSRNSFGKCGSPAMADPGQCKSDSDYDSAAHRDGSSR